MSEPLRWKDPKSKAPRDVQVLLQNHQARSNHTPRPSWERQTKRPGVDLRWGIAAAALAMLVLWFVVRPVEAPSPGPLAGVVAQGVLTLEGRQLGTTDGVTLPSTLQTHNDPATLNLNNGDQVMMSAHGEFTLKDLPECSPCLVVHRGTATLDVQHRAVGSSPLVVHSAPWRVVALGTRFRVTRHPPRDVRVDVDNGVVRVEGPRPARKLRAGEHFDSRAVTSVATATATSVVTPASKPTTPKAPQHNLRIIKTTRQQARKAADVGASTREQAHDAKPPTAATTPPGRNIREASDFDVSQNSGDIGQPKHWADDPPALEQDASKRSHEIATPVVDKVPKRPTTKDQQLALLRTARQSKDSDAALRALDAAAALGPPLAEVASYRAARLRLKARAFDDSSQRLRKHIESWPRGELSDAAHLDLIESELRRGDIKAAQNQLQHTLRRFPELGSEASLQFLRAEIARSNKSWEAAAADYARAARVPEYAPRALFLEALSHARSGERQVARLKMVAYLKRFPDGVFADEAKKALGDSVGEGNASP